MVMFIDMFIRKRFVVGKGKR